MLPPVFDPAVQTMKTQPLPSFQDSMTLWCGSLCLQSQTPAGGETKWATRRMDEQCPKQQLVQRLLLRVLDMSCIVASPG